MVTDPNNKNAEEAPFCACGCGGRVQRVTKTQTRRGKKKGDWWRYIQGHSGIKIAHNGACKDRNSYMKLWRLAHLEECKRKDREKYTILKQQVMEAYGGAPPKCACCGESGFPFLTIDHIVPVRRKQNNVYDNTKLAGTGLYANLRANNYPPGFQVLCFNCNCAKRTLGECPHKTMKEVSNV